MASKTQYRFVIGLVGFVLLLGMVLPSGWTLSEKEKSMKELGEETTILFPRAGIEFDVGEGEPALPSELRVSPENDYSHDVVQFRDKVKSEWLDELRDMGAEVYQGVHYNAYVVKMGRDLREKVKSLDFVQWVGLYQPAYKVLPSLLEKKGKVKVSVLLFQGEDFSHTLKILESLGDVYETWQMYGQIRVKVDASEIPEIARLDAVQYVLDDPDMIIYNDVAGEIEKNHDAWYSTVSGLYNPNTGAPIDLTGKGEVIGFADTGFDVGSASTGHPDFFNGPLGDRVIRVQGRGSATPDDEGIGHGTHTSGDALGNGWASEWAKGLDTNDHEYHEGFAGVAPEAMLSMDSCGVGGGLIVPTPDVWYSEYSDGARQMSNSWGPRSVDNTYGSTAQYVDMFMWDKQNGLVVFAAGNDGPSGWTVSGGGNSHNGLSVGAAENDKPANGANSDDPSQLASYSSRGPIDLRVKPDIVATSELAGPKYHYATADEYADIPGYNYYNPSTSDYWYMGGTSASTPRAAGHAALTRQFYKEYYGLNDTQITSALVKATLINGAVDMGYGYPSYDQGWGKVNIKNSLFPNPPRTNQWATGTLGTSQVWDAETDGGMNLDIVSDDVPLKVTMVHLVPPGMMIADDLDLLAVSPSGVHYVGNAFATSGEYDDWSMPNPTWMDWVPQYDFDIDNDNDDDLNTVENVFVKNPEVGKWTIEVIGDYAPDNPPFALIFSADVGPQRDYQIDLSTDYPLTYSVVAGGSIVFPFKALNFGTSDDTVALSDTIPDPRIHLSYSTGTSLSLKSGNGADVLSVMTFDSGIPAGVYEFDIKGTSQNDFTVPIASDKLHLKVEILERELPRVIRVTNDTWSQTEPSILAFNNGTTDHVFIAYKNEQSYGARVFLKHSTDGGLTFGPPVQISTIADGPSDIRLNYFNESSTSYPYRVFVSWHGTDPNNPDTGDWSYVAYSDPPYDTWTSRHVDTNSGPALYRNVKRMTFLLPLPTPPTGPKDQLIMINEILEYDSSGQTDPNQVSVTVFYSNDGGYSWTGPEIISPTNGDYHFFPNGVVDKFGNGWVLYYYRSPGSGVTDRDLCFDYYDGTGWQGKVDIWNTGDSLMFPAGTSTSEGPNGNRIYDAFTKSTSASTPKKLRVVYTDDMGQTWEPWTGVPPWDPTKVQAFGPYGDEISEIGYVTRPVLDMDQAGNALWVTYLEEGPTANIYQVPNVQVAYSLDGFASATVMKITADAYAKGHPMSDSIGPVMYTTYHSRNQRGDNDIYLRIYWLDWEKENDTLGPETTIVAGLPNPLNKTAFNQFNLTANIDDVSSGFSNISAAEYFVQQNMPSLGDYGSGTSMSPKDGAFDSIAEAVNATIAVPIDWVPGNSYRVWVHGMDEHGNWGPPEYVDIVIRAFEVLPKMPVLTDVFLEPTLSDVTLYWNASGDEWAGDNPVIYYNLYRTTTYGQNWTLLGNVTATGSPSYNWTDLGRGHGDPNNYFYCVKAFNTIYESECMVGAKFTMFLSSGKHFASIPLILSNESVGHVLQTVSYKVVWSYDAWDYANHWKSLSRSKYTSDLSKINFTMGFWIDVLSNCNLTVAGIVPDNTVIRLETGWNMVGFPIFASSVTVGDLRAQLGARKVEGFNASLPPYLLEVLPDSYVLVPGEAYWIYVPHSTTWTIEN